jgi:trehalose 6-phosphate phosphatase
MTPLLPTDFLPVTELPKVVATTLPAPPLPDGTASWALLLDVDGSLLSFADDPEAVHVELSLARTLLQLHEHLDGALALISGRTIASLDHLFGQPRWAVAGLHGLEMRTADGPIERTYVDPTQRDRVFRAASDLAASLPGVRIEDKGVSIALHFREAPWQETALDAAVPRLIEDIPSYELQPGNHVFEFKPRGMNKGWAVAHLLDTSPFVGRTPVYIGDDLTDEYAFAVTNAHKGMSIRVGTREPTSAHFTLFSPPAVHAWLDSVLNALKQGGVTDAHSGKHNASG